MTPPNESPTPPVAHRIVAAGPRISSTGARGSSRVHEVGDPHPRHAGGSAELKGAGARRQDLRWATELAEAAERMNISADLSDLVVTVAAEAAALVAADGVAIMARGPQGWRTVIAPPTAASPDPTYGATWATAVAQAGLLEPGCTSDLEESWVWGLARTALRPPMNSGGWRAYLVTSLSPPRTRESVRLVWYSRQPGAFDDHADVAALLARHAALSFAAVLGRENFDQALETRSRIGQAMGLLMSRDGLTSDQALAQLRKRSQAENVRVRQIAERVLSDHADARRRRPAPRRPAATARPGEPG